MIIETSPLPASPPGTFSGHETMTLRFACGGTPLPRLSLLIMLLGGCAAAGAMPPSRSPATAADGFLADWMGHVSTVIGSQTLLDLSLPGTHDSMTFDLSTTFSDGANDLPPVVSWVLHEFRDLAPGPFVRNQSKTQGLNMTEQLQSGVRFMDFRIMFSAPPNGSASAAHDWFCLHMMESNNRALEYLTEARRFMDTHPGELLVLWLSRHGSACLSGQGQYPDVTAAQKRAFWAQIETLFDGMLLDSRTQAPNVTTYQEMVATGRRVVIYAADYAAFTGNSSLAIDSCLIDNQLGSDMTDEPRNLPSLLAAFRSANATKMADKRQNRFYLKSLAGGPPSTQIAYAAEAHFLPPARQAAEKKCAALFHIPGMDSWCPMTLQAAAQLENYYNQIALDAVITQGLHLPNAIYINAVDLGGTIRTGTAVFGVDAEWLHPAPVSDDHATTGFAYVDTFILYNVRRICQASSPAPVACASLIATLEKRRTAYPLLTWADPTHGRLVGWPANSTAAIA